jgi:hypothetical protein
LETIETTEKHISSYGKVYRTGNKFVENVFLGEVTVQEKIDGCFDYSMRVKLSDGTGLEIGKIVNQQLPVEVLTYNTDTNKVESKKIVNWFRYDHDGEFLKLIVKGRSSSRKNKIIVTKNHMIYTNKGKVEAETLKVGDTVYTANYKLDYVQEQMILGTLLGDACIQNVTEHSYIISLGHSMEEYTKLKEKICLNLSHNSDIRKSGYGSTMYRLILNTHPSFSAIADIVKIGNKKCVTQEWIDKLSPMSLAFWYMDDGSFNEQIRLATNGFSLNEQELLVSKLNSFGVLASIFEDKRGKGYYLNISQSNCDSFFSLIAQYVPKFMEHKLPNKWRFSSNFWDHYHFDPIGMSLFETEILDIETINNNSSCKFDIEVEDNHNYYCGNILVSNSQFSWCKGDNGDTLFRSRNVQMDNTVYEQMFERGIVALHEIHDSFNPDFIYRGEYLNTPKHHAVKYERVPERHVILFDIELRNRPQTFLSSREVKEEALRLGLDVVPTYFNGVANAEDLLRYLDMPPYLGGEYIEGIVIKNYELAGMYGHVAKAKIVRADFRETQAIEWRIQNPTAGDIVQNIIKSLRTEARWNKAIQHLEESGQLTNEAKDIGPLLKEVNKDLLDEEQDAIKDILFKYYWKNISKGVINGLPEFYKRKLMGLEK